MQLINEISNVRVGEHYGAILPPGVEVYQNAYHVVQKDMDTFVTECQEVVIPKLQCTVKKLMSKLRCPKYANTALQLNALGKIPQAYESFRHGPPPMYTRAGLGDNPGNQSLQPTPLIDAEMSIGAMEKEFGPKNKETLSFGSCDILRFWGGEHLNLYGVCLLVHIVNLGSAESFVERATSNSNAGSKLLRRNTYVAKKVPLNRHHLLMTLLSFGVLSVYLATTIRVLGSGNRPDAAHVLSIPLPVFFLSHYNPSNVSKNLSEVYINAFAYLEGFIGTVQYEGTSKNRNGGGQKSVPNTVSMKTNYRIPRDGSVHFLLERRDPRRLMGLMNLLGYFQYLPRLLQILKVLDPLNPYTDAIINSKDSSKGIRNQCLLSLFFDMPILVQPKSATFLNGVLGTGSEKTVFKLSVAPDVLKTNSQEGKDGREGRDLAIRMNTGIVEFTHHETCLGESMKAAVGFYQQGHLLMPVMQTADAVVKKNVDLRVLLEFIESVLLQLEQLNESGYIHRDLKLKNVLTLSCLREKLELESAVIPLSPVCKSTSYGQMYLLSDFGHTAAVGRNVTCSTKAYADPCHIYRPADPKMDIWCLGLVMLKLCTTTTPLRETLKEFYKVFNADKLELRGQKKETEMGDLYRQKLRKWSEWWKIYIWDPLEGVETRNEVFIPIWSPPDWSSDYVESEIMNCIFLVDFIRAIKRCLSMDLNDRWSVDIMLNWCRYWRRSLDFRTCVPPTPKHLYITKETFDETRSRGSKEGSRAESMSLRENVEMEDAASHM